jgi:hypothetical protein
MAEWEAELKKEAKIEIMESSEHPARKDDVR